MKFNEAIRLMQDGNKITRHPWYGSVYFVLEGQDIKSYQPKIVNFVYNEEIMISDGWEVENKEGEHKFCDVVSYLISGLKVYRKEWGTNHIYLDKQTRTILFYSMDVLSFTPDFESFMAHDWIMIPD